MANSALIAVWAFMMCAACMTALWFGFRRRIVTPWILFLLMSIFDMFIPAGLTAMGFNWAARGINNRWAVEWVAPTARLMLGRAVLVATVATALFGMGYLAASRIRTGRRALYRFHRGRAILLFVLAAAGYLIFLFSQLAVYGSFAAVLDYFVANRFAGAAPQAGANMLLAVSLDIYLLELIAIIFFVHSRSRTSRLLWFLAGLVVASLRLFRGSVLVYLLALAVLEQEGVQRFGRHLTRLLQRREVRRRVYAFLAIGAVLFTGYGVLRNVATARSGRLEMTFGNSMMIEMDRFVRGEGLVGLASVLDFYPRNAQFFHGKTIRDMLLLPVPRLIWPSKPSWYGIDDITRTMGWPQSTGSPVSMPGELYANFGYPGIALMFVYGLLFGAFAAMAGSSRVRFIYALFLLPAMLPTFWMGFTGFMNHLVAIPLALITLVVVFRPLRVLTVRVVVRDRRLAGSPQWPVHPLGRTSQ